MLESVTTIHLSGPWWAAPPLLLSERSVFSLPFPSSLPCCLWLSELPLSLQHTQQPAGLSLEPRWGKERSHRICLEDSACALCLLEEKGGSQQHDDLSPHPVPSCQLCPPRPANQCRLMPSLLYCPFLAMGSGQGQSTQLCLPPPRTCQLQTTFLGLLCQPAFPSISCARARMSSGVQSQSPAIFPWEQSSCTAARVLYLCQATCFQELEPVCAVM